MDFLLLLLLPLLSCSGTTSGSAVVRVTEGSEAVLPCFIKPEQNIERDVFEWRKGGQKVFLYKNRNHSNNGLPGQDEQFKGRVSHFPEQLQFSNASIRIRDIKESDRGTYTCDFSPDEPNRQIFYIDLVVVSAVIRVTEGSEAVLPCFIRPKNIERDAFVWRKGGQKVFLYKNSLHSNNVLPGQDEQFKGRVSHFPDQLQFGDASIRIKDTKESDSGTYSCVFSPDEPNRQTFRIDLVVVCRTLKDRSEENIPGACKEPSLETPDETRDWSLLKCVVRGAFPKPKVQWRDSDGNNLTAEEPQVTETGGSYDITLQINVTKTGRYRCVVTQLDICHIKSAESKVYIHVFTDPEPSKGPPTGWIIAAVLCPLFVFFVCVLYNNRNKIQNCMKGQDSTI